MLAELLILPVLSETRAQRVNTNGRPFLGCQCWRSFRGCQCCQSDLSRLSRRRSSSGHSRRQAWLRRRLLASACAGCGQQGADVLQCAERARRAWRDSEEESTTIVSDCRRHSAKAAAPTTTADSMLWQNTLSTPPLCLDLAPPSSRVPCVLSPLIDQNFVLSEVLC